MGLTRTDREKVIKRVEQWLVRLETAKPWNNDGGELVGKLTLRAYNNGYEDSPIDILCKETLAEEEIG